MTTQTPQLNVLTTVALKGVLEQLAPEFRAATGYDLAMRYGPGGVVMRWLREGAAADVIVVTPEGIETLVRDGLAVAGSGRSLGSSVVGAAVRAGANRPAIGTVEQFRDALLAAKSVAYTDPSTGAASGCRSATASASSTLCAPRRSSATAGQSRSSSRAAKPSWPSSS
jgi:molybdate transport system substrate-binding protein